MSNGFVADIPGAVNRGQQFQFQQQMRPIQLEQAQQVNQFNQLKQEQLRQQIDQRTEEQKNLSFVNSVMQIQSLPDEQKLPALIQQEQKILASGGDPSDTRKGIELAQQGKFKELNQGISNILTQAERQGIIKAAPVKKLSSLQQKVEAEGLDPFTKEGQARAREITQGSRTDPSLKPTDQALLNKANEGQLAASVFANRVESANDILASLETKKDFDPTSIQTAVLEVLPGGNIALSEDEQKYAQAKRDFITAVLRKESGAAIGKDEFLNEDKKFFPQVGDKPAVLKQKALGRKRAFENLKAQSKGVFNVQFGKKTGELSKAEKAELEQLRAELGQ